MDLLWSDPTPSADTMGVHNNVVRDPRKENNICMFGSDMVDKFLKNNQMNMIIRSHQKCQGGIDQFANDQVFTITSCSNYNNAYNNDACFLVM